jgi:integration host factor subunit beta
MSTLTKKDFVDGVAQSLHMDRDQVREVLREFLEQLTERLGDGARVEFRDFGVFEVRARAARVAQNPKTLQPVKVPARRTVKFKPGRLMKDRLDPRADGQTGLLESPFTGDSDGDGRRKSA